MTVFGCSLEQVGMTHKKTSLVLTSAVWVLQVIDKRPDKPQKDDARRGVRSLASGVRMFLGASNSTRPMMTEQSNHAVLPHESVQDRANCW